MREPISFKTGIPVASDPDTSALDRVRAGDPTALAELYDRHSAILYGLMIRITADVTTADDLLSDVFMRIWTGADTYDSALGSPRAWLIGLARYRALDHLQSTGGGGGGHPRVKDPGADASTSWRHVLKDEEQGKIGAVLESLPDAQRNLIAYTFFRGFSVPELASHFQLSVEQVKAGLHLGMHALRERLTAIGRLKGGTS